MTQPFARHSQRKPLKQPRRPATICGRPAHEVVAERRSLSVAASSGSHTPDASHAPASEAGRGREPQ